MAPAVARPLLEAIEIKKHFAAGGGFLRGPRCTVRAVDGVSLRIYPGETLGVVGESGCGKSTLARCLVRLHTLSDGALLFDDVDIATLSRRALRPVRRHLQMVFQDPFASLNPRRRIGDLLAEPLRVNGWADPEMIEERLLALLALVGLQPDHLERFPHEFSGGQRQRIGIARALALSPKLLVADEPVSALDVSIQAQIVNLFSDLQEQLGLTYVFVAHDLSVVRQVSTRVAVMYLGVIVELGAAEALFHAPAHPYTEALISAVPVAGVAGARRQRIVLSGDPPSPIDPPPGCRFAPRCRLAAARCRNERPVLRAVGEGRVVACHFPLGG